MSSPADSLFACAIGLDKPWFLYKVDFSPDDGKTEIDIDFPRGSRFCNDFSDHGSDLDGIRHVCCHMSPAFIEGIECNLPDAHITFDRFHVMRLMNKAVDKVSRTEPCDVPLLKKSRWVWLKNPENLTVKQQTCFNELSPLNLKIGTVFRTSPKPRYPIGIVEGIFGLNQDARSKARGYRSNNNLITMIFITADKLKFGLATQNIEEPLLITAIGLPAPTNTCLSFSVST